MRIIIIGAGEIGFHIAQTLSLEGKDVVVIDRDEQRLSNISDSLDVQTIHGSGSSTEILRKARLNHADMVVALTDSDETNMIACLLASTQSQIPLRIARIRNPELSSNALLLDKNHLNIDLCINPELEAAKNVMGLIEYPGASEIFSFAEGKIKLLGFSIDEKYAHSGKKIWELRQKYRDVKVLISSIIRNNELIVPSGESLIFPHDYIFIATETSAVRKVLGIFGKDTGTPRRVIISGGGAMGLMLAELIEKKEITTRVIEKSKERCEFLASRLDKAIILHGDGTSQELLKQENIQGTDFFMAVTNDEEANILGALLAKQLGAKKVISLISRMDYIPLVTAAGIDGVINPRGAAISRMLHFFRRGKIISATQLRDEKMEAFEFIAMETSDIINQPFKDIHFPKGAIVGAIARGDEVIIPDGNSVIIPGDHVIIFTPRSALAQVEKLLMVKLEYFA